ncbi:MAG TPA: hypothetical protein VFJ51_08720 [Nitrososphaeraceae archaeon]|nr:hypothetical protein [Nitrososphaeraceae archaeon]
MYYILLMWLPGIKKSKLKVTIGRNTTANNYSMGLKEKASRKI